METLTGYSQRYIPAIMRVVENNLEVFLVLVLVIGVLFHIFFEAFAWKNLVVQIDLDPGNRTGNIVGASKTLIE